jgi:hypothetical protein
MFGKNGSSLSSFNLTSGSTRLFWNRCNMIKLF